MAEEKLKAEASPGAKTELTLVLFKAREDSLVSAENFLTNRGWKVKSFTSIKEVLASVMTKMPDFLVYCADHPNKTGRLLPLVLKNKMQIPSIAFFDNPTSPAEIKKCGNEFYLVPPVSGPAIDRMTAKIQKQLAQQDPTGEIRTRQRQSNMKSVEELLRLQGGATAEDDSLIYMNRLLGDKMSATSEGTGTGNQLSATQESGATKNPTTSGMSPMGVAAPLSGTQGGAKGSAKSASTGARPQMQMRAKSAFNQNPAMLAAFESAFDKLNQAPQLSPESSAGIRAGDTADMMAGSTGPVGASVGVPQTATKVLCLVVEAVSCSGYLLAAMARSRLLDPQIMKQMSSTLNEYFRSQGHDVAPSEPMTLSLPSVEFTAWAAAHGEFLHQSVHGEDQVAMAFFECLETEIPYSRSAREDMFSLSLNELVEEAVLEFDIYVHLPANDRFLLYRGRGWPLHARQKQKLLESGVDRVLIAKDQIGSLKKYRAQNFLSASIQHFSNT